MCEGNVESGREAIAAAEATTATKRRSNETILRPMQENKKEIETNELNNDTKTRKRNRAQTNLQWHENKRMQLAEEERNQKAHMNNERSKRRGRKYESVSDALQS